MIVVGADVSAARVAFVATNTEDSEWLLIKKNVVAKRSGPEAVYGGFLAAADFCEHLRAHYPDDDMAVWVEDALVGVGGFNSTKVQAYTNGGVQAAFMEYEGVVSMVNQSTWKKQVIGNGGANKEAVAAALGVQWPILFQSARGDQDLLDAGAINRYGAMVLGRVDGLTVASKGGV